MATHKKFIPDLRSKNYSFAIDNRFIHKKIIASIFFGFYERGETRFINKYLNPKLDVIELGASLGIVSSHIVHKLEKGARLILVEANPYLQQTINTNVAKHNTNNISYQLLNYAISYGSDMVSLRITGDNTESHVIKKGPDNTPGVSVEAISLSAILNKVSMNDYAIVCDIEGSELEWLLNENECIKNCRQLLIELHAVDYDKHYSIDDIKNIIIDKHKFQLVDSHGPVCYFEK